MFWADGRWSKICQNHFFPPDSTRFCQNMAIFEPFFPMDFACKCAGTGVFFRFRTALGEARVSTRDGIFSNTRAALPLECCLEAWGSIGVKMKKKCF